MYSPENFPTCPLKFVCIESRVGSWCLVISASSSFPHTSAPHRALRCKWAFPHPLTHTNIANSDIGCHLLGSHPNSRQSHCTRRSLSASIPSGEVRYGRDEISSALLRGKSQYAHRSWARFPISRILSATPTTPTMHENAICSRI